VVALCQWAEDPAKGVLYRSLTNSLPAQPWWPGSHRPGSRRLRSRQTFLFPSSCCYRMYRPSGRRRTARSGRPEGEGGGSFFLNVHLC